MAFFEFTIPGEETKRVMLEPVPVNYIECGDHGPKVGREPTPTTLASIYRSKRHTILIAWEHQPILVNYRRVVVLKRICDGDQLAAGTLSFVFRELEALVLTGESELLKAGAKKCLVCRKPFKVGQQVIYCPACRSPYHEQCWQYLKGHCANGKVCQYQAQWDEAEA